MIDNHSYYIDYHNNSLERTHQISSFLRFLVRFHPVSRISYTPPYPGISFIEQEFGI
jgi:hypothetical protein